MPTSSLPTLVGVDQNELVGRALADLVHPEYAELVRENIRRRLKGEAAAERYEIDMLGLQGQVSRLEIGSTLIDYEGESALLITGAEILPTQTVPQLAQLPAAADGSDGAAPAYAGARLTRRGGDRDRCAGAHPLHESGGAAPDGQQRRCERGAQA